MDDSHNLAEQPEHSGLPDPESVRSFLDTFPEEEWRLPDPGSIRAYLDLERGRDSVEAFIGLINRKLSPWLKSRYGRSAAAHLHDDILEEAWRRIVVRRHQFNAGRVRFDAWACPIVAECAEEALARLRREAGLIDVGTGNAYTKPES